MTSPEAVQAYFLLKAANMSEDNENLPEPRVASWKISH